MFKDVIYVTRERLELPAFIANSDKLPDFARNCRSVLDDGTYHFACHEKEFLDCKADDIVYFGHCRNDEHYLSVLEPNNCYIENGIIYEKNPIYMATLVDFDLPDFMSDIKVSFDGKAWHLDTPRLRIVVNIGDYWIRDIDLDGRFDTPIISAIGRDQDSFTRMWRCDKSGKYLEKLTDYDRRTYPSFPSP